MPGAGRDDVRFLLHPVHGDVRDDMEGTSWEGTEMEKEERWDARDGMEAGIYD